jgi:hypothetical protein
MNALCLWKLRKGLAGVSKFWSAIGSFINICQLVDMVGLVNFKGGPTDFSKNVLASTLN